MAANELGISERTLYRKIKEYGIECKRNFLWVPGKITVLLFILGLSMVGGCKVNYSFSGASISPLVKTISIQYFQNRASLVQPGLSQYITDALIDKCKAQTSLKFTK